VPPINGFRLIIVTFVFTVVYTQGVNTVQLHNFARAYCHCSKEAGLDIPKLAGEVILGVLQSDLDCEVNFAEPKILV